MGRHFIIFAALIGLLSSCGFHRKKYENPISKDTKQPDKVLFDKAINDIEHGRYEVARITLNTLINTYDQSEYLAKAKLAIADSWFREGGASGLAQAEAEYKDFILFYPTMEEAAESQEKICQIHYNQMNKADRDAKQAVRAEDECRQLITQFPNSKFVPQAQQLLRNIQEALAEEEFRVGDYYHHKGSNPAAANRMSALVNQYPLYSKADQALWEMGDSYSKMGPRFRQKAGDAYARIVRDYPLSSLSDAAKKRLNELEIPIPEVDRAAYDRMKYELANRHKPGMLGRSTSFLHRGPDVWQAAKAGAPAMTSLRPSVPASVPVPVDNSNGGFKGDVGAQVVADTSAIDSKPDARAVPPSAEAAKSGSATTSTDPAAPASGETKPAGTAAPPPQKSAINNPNQDLPTNYQGQLAKMQKKKNKKKKNQTTNAAQQGTSSDSTATTPPAAQPAAKQ
jgi:outer membrane protein assembly factor BamD